MLAWNGKTAGEDAHGQISGPREYVNARAYHQYQLQQQRESEPFKYLALPVELRLRIADYYLLGGPFTPGSPRQVNIANDEPKFMNTALLHTCRTIYAELRDHYHTRFTLAFGARHLRGNGHVADIGGMLCKIGQIRYLVTTFQITLSMRSFAPAQAESDTMAAIAYTMIQCIPNLEVLRFAVRMQVYPQEDPDDMSRVLKYSKKRTAWVWNMVLGLLRGFPESVRITSRADAERIQCVPSDTVDSIVTAIRSGTRIRDYLDGSDESDLTAMRRCDWTFSRSKTGGKLVGWIVPSARKPRNMDRHGAIVEAGNGRWLTVADD